MAENPIGAEIILGSSLPEERLARAMAMGVPAFVRRAQAVEAAREELYCTMARERSKRLRALFPLARSLDANRRRGDALPGAALETLAALREEPGFASRVAPPRRSPRRASAELVKRVADFNRRWSLYLESVCIEKLQKAAADYNRYYPIEREMALPRTPQTPFKEVPILARRDLSSRFPPLSGG
jgi:hypothetical protein